jgi:hypothetical protein
LKHGQSDSLNCNSEENEKGSVRWSYSLDGKTKWSKLDEESKFLKVPPMKESVAGYYRCVVENSIGFATKQFQILHTSNGKQLIKFN